MANKLLSVFLNYKIVLKTWPCLTVAAQKKYGKGKGTKILFSGMSKNSCQTSSTFLSFNMHSVVTLHQFCTQKRAVPVKKRACIASISAGLCARLKHFFAVWLSEYQVLRGKKAKMLQMYGKGYRNTCYTG